MPVFNKAVAITGNAKVHTPKWVYVLVITFDDRVQQSESTYFSAEMAIDRMGQTKKLVEAGEADNVIDVKILRYDGNSPHRRPVELYAYHTFIKLPGVYGEHNSVKYPDSVGSFDIIETENCYD